MIILREQRRFPFAARLLPFVVVIMFWYGVSFAVFAARGVSFPTPVETLVRFVHLLSGEPFLKSTIYEHTLISLSRWLAGFLLFALVGIPMGILAGTGFLTGCSPR